MPSEFVDYLAGYLKKQSENYKTYLLAALENKDHTVNVLASSEGVPTNSKQIRDFELLCDAKIFDEKVQFSHSGRNVYKIFRLTELGLQLAEGLKNQEAITAQTP